MSTLRSQPRRRAKIGLTALIDVVFILLLFFMLSTSFTRWHSLPLKLSASTSSAMSDTQSETIKILENQAVLIAGQIIGYHSIASLDVSKAAWFSLEVHYLLKPLPTSSVQEVVDVMVGLGAAGVKNLKLSGVQND